MKTVFGYITMMNGLIATLTNTTRSIDNMVTYCLNLLFMIIGTN